MQRGLEGSCGVWRGPLWRRCLSLHLYILAECAGVSATELLTVGFYFRKSRYSGGGTMMSMCLTQRQGLGLSLKLK